MKFLFGLLVVFLMLGFVSAPAMACDHDCGNCPNSGTCNGNDDGECPGDDCDDDHNGGGHDDDHGGCSGGSCPI